MESGSDYDGGCWQSPEETWADTKTDRRDATMLASLFRAGEGVWGAAERKSYVSAETAPAAGLLAGVRVRFTDGRREVVQRIKGASQVRIQAWLRIVKPGFRGIPEGGHSDLSREIREAIVDPSAT